MAIQPIGAQNAVQMAYLNQRPTSWKQNIARHSTDVMVPVTKEEIDAKQNNDLLVNLDYVGRQVKALLDLTAGREVKVVKDSNPQPEDEYKTPAQKQKDDAIVQIGYIGDCLNKLVKAKAGKLDEAKPKKQHG